MRILFAADVDPNPNSGAAGTEWQTIQGLRRRGHEVDEIWAADLGRRIRHGNLHYLLELPRAFRREIRRRCEAVEYDVIHVNQGHCYLAAADHRRLGRHGVFVCRSHGLDDHMERVLGPWRRRLGIRGRRGPGAIAGKMLAAALHRHDHRAYRLASGIIVSSSLDEEYLVEDRRVPCERVGRIPQAPARAFVESDAASLSADRLHRILHVGGFAYWKGVHAVAEAMNRLFDRTETCEMTWLCRDSEHDRVRSLLSDGALRRVRLVGWTSQEELLTIYDAHGIFLCPSLFDGFGKVFLEAMARGLCVIGTPTGGMRDIVRQDGNGYLVGFHDPNGIVRTIEAIWDDPVAAARVGKSAADDARAYSWDRVARETESFYMRLAALGPRGNP